MQYKMDFSCSEKRNATRKALVTAVRTLVAARGHDRISVQEITRQARVATGTFYNYFESKQDIFAAGAEDICAELAELLAETRTGIKDPAMRVSVTLKYYFQQASENQEWLRYIDALSLDLTLQQPSEQCFDDIERGVKAGRFRIDDIHFTQNLVSGMVGHVTREIAAGRIEPEGIGFAIRSILQMLGLPDLVSKALTQTPLPPIAASKRQSPTIQNNEVARLSDYSNASAHKVISE